MLDGWHREMWREERKEWNVCRLAMDKWCRELAAEGCHLSVKKLTKSSAIREEVGGGGGGPNGGVTHR